MKVQKQASKQTTVQECTFCKARGSVTGRGGGVWQCPVCGGYNTLPQALTVKGEGK